MKRAKQTHRFLSWAEVRPAFAVICDYLRSRRGRALLAATLQTPALDRDGRAYVEGDHGGPIYLDGHNP